MKRQNDLRTLLESGTWPPDEKTVRRLALRAAARIGDPDRHAELYDRLLMDLSAIELEHLCGGDGAEARRTVLATLDEIEAASRPN